MGNLFSTGDGHSLSDEHNYSFYEPIYDFDTDTESEVDIEDESISSQEEIEKEKYVTTIKAIGFVLFQARMKVHGNLGWDNEINELIVRIFQRYAEINSEIREAYLEHGLRDLKMEARLYSQGRPGYYNTWRGFRDLLKQRARNVYAQMHTLPN